MNPNQPQEKPTELFGAGGNWPVIDEIIDPTVVPQQNQLYCGPACGEMLLKDRGISVSQATIASETGLPADVRSLALALNSLDPKESRRWRGGTLQLSGANESELLEVLSTTGSWAAVFWEPGDRIGHLVVSDGFNKAGQVMIRDPRQPGTRYKMTVNDFLQYWTSFGVYAIEK